MVGVRPMTVDAPDWTAWLGHLQTVLIAGLLLIGYSLECLAGFRYKLYNKAKRLENIFNLP